MFSKDTFSGSGLCGKELIQSHTDCRDMSYAVKKVFTSFTVNSLPRMAHNKILDLSTLKIFTCENLKGYKNLHKFQQGYGKVCSRRNAGYDHFLHFLRKSIGKKALEKIVGKGFQINEFGNEFNCNIY